MTSSKDRHRIHALVLLLVSALARLPNVLSSGRDLMPVYFDGSYIVAGKYLLHGQFHALGIRTPVYPALLAICGINLRAIFMVQALLGIAAALLIFQLALRRTGNSLVALLIGLVCSLSPDVLLHESSVMTETL